MQPILSQYHTNQTAARCYQILTHEARLMCGQISLWSSCETSCMTELGNACNGHSSILQIDIHGLRKCALGLCVDGYSKIERTQNLRKRFLNRYKSVGPSTRIGHLDDTTLQLASVRFFHPKLFINPHGMFVTHRIHPVAAFAHQSSTAISKCSKGKDLNTRRDIQGENTQGAA